MVVVRGCMSTFKGVDWQYVEITRGEPGRRWGGSEGTKSEAREGKEVRGRRRWGGTKRGGGGVKE